MWFLSPSVSSIYQLVNAVILCALHHAGFPFVLRMLYCLCAVLNVACTFSSYLQVLKESLNH
jgi:hypothetical protein